MSDQARDAELAELIAAQEADDQWGHRVRSLSLDAEISSDANAGTWHEIHGEADSALDALTGSEPATAVRRIPRPQKWTRRQIISAIRKWEKEHGEPPRYCDWDRVNGRGFPSVSSVARHFGSFAAGVEAAGFRYQDARRHPIQGTRIRKRIRDQKFTAHMTRAELASAYVLYERQHLDLPQLATLLWEKYGFRNARACENAIWRGFHSEGFQLRTKSENWRRLTDDQRKLIVQRRALAKAKLSAEDVLAIRASTERQVDLAEKYGVAQTTISRIKRGTSHNVVLEAARAA